MRWPTDQMVPSLTAERLRELLHYDPDTGVFTWRVMRPGKHDPQPTPTPKAP